MKFRSLLFLLLLVFWCSAIIGVYLFFFASQHDQYMFFQTSYEVWERLRYSLLILFEFADAWNWIALTFIFSVAILLFCINDIFLRKFFQGRFPGQQDKLYISGSIWLLRTLTNMGVFLFQVVIFCWLVNVTVSSPSILEANEIHGTSHTVLVLGTSKYLKRSINLNRYYTERIATTVELYKRGVTNRIVISGDHQGKEYSEPLDMQADLIAGGVPKKIIELDLNGYRTFDSILRLRKSSHSSLIIVSQFFHLERALYMAKAEGLDVIGVAAKGSMTAAMFKREIFAKTKVLLDIYIFNTQAYGLPAHPRRNLDFLHFGDLLLMLFVCGMIYLAGTMTRQLLVF
jgi:SanA protein